MAEIVFFCHDSRENIQTFEYYKQDLEALESLGHEVVVCTKYQEIPPRFDAMVVWWWSRAFLPVLLCRMLRRPCIVTGVFNFRFPAHLTGNDYFGKRGWQRFLIRNAARLADLNLFLNE